MGQEGSRADVVERPEMDEAIQTLGAEIARTVGFITDRLDSEMALVEEVGGSIPPCPRFCFFLPPPPSPLLSPLSSSFSPPFLLPPCPRFCFLFGVGCLVWVVWWCCGVGWVGLCGGCVGVWLGWVGFCGCGLFGGVCVLFVGVMVWFVPSCVCLRVLCMFPVCLLWCEF